MRIRPLEGAFPLLAMLLLADDIVGPPRPAVLDAHSRLGADVLQFGLPDTKREQRGGRLWQAG